MQRSIPVPCLSRAQISPSAEKQLCGWRARARAHTHTAHRRPNLKSKDFKSYTKE